MDVLVVGAGGMLGQEVVRVLESRGAHVRGIDLPELDLTDPVSVAHIGAGTFGTFDWCVNCAAYTAVDRAESEPDMAMSVNALGAGYLANVCKLAGIRLLHLSTDFVFDGTASSPYPEEQAPNPLGVYGRSKWEGERAVLAASPASVVVRTAWLYGPDGPSFPRTLIRAWLAGKELRVVADQTGSPTYTADLARVLADLIRLSPEGGVYHAAGPDAMTWRDLAEMAILAYRDEVLREDRTVHVVPITAADWPTPAPRPAYSVLSFDKLARLGVEPMRPVREAMAEFVRRLPAEP